MDANLIRADIRKTAEVRSAIARLDFDVVVDWIAYDVGHVKNDIELFKNKTAQYIFVSSASVPVTIVRPSHTYDRTMIPLHGGYTVIERMKKGKKVIIHGDGTSLWTLTHHKDFAKGFIGLLGNDDAIGESYHITSDEILTWNQIFEFVAIRFH